jgi:P-type Mg2+ transporter
MFAHHAQREGTHARPLSIGELFNDLKSSPAGLTSVEAAARLVSHGANRLREDSGHHPVAVLFRQFQSPLVLILLAAAVLSFLLGEVTEASIVVGIVVASTGLGFYQEYRAGNAVAALQRRIAITAVVLRDGAARRIPVPAMFLSSIREV